MEGFKPVGGEVCHKLGLRFPLVILKDASPVVWYGGICVVKYRYNKILDSLGITKAIMIGYKGQNSVTHL